MRENNLRDLPTQKWEDPLCVGVNNSHIIVELQFCLLYVNIFFSQDDTYPWMTAIPYNCLYIFNIGLLIEVIYVLG